MVQALGLSAEQGASLATGAIDGKAKDATGAALADVVVALTSDALLQSRSVRTDREGIYRFPAVPPGVYTLVLTRDGFATTTREGVRVDVAFTATVDVVMELRTLSDAITVVRPSPTLDRNSAAFVSTLTAGELAHLPGARNMAAILAATPAVQVTNFDVGGHTTALGVNTSAFGISGHNRPMMEGIDATGIQATGFVFDYGSFDEVLVTTAAHSAEWPKPGVQSQFIAKSGGDEYRGSIYVDYENRHWQAFNIDAGQVDRGSPRGGGLDARDANRLWSYGDRNADVGGFVSRGRAWWYGSLRDQHVDARYINFSARPFRNRTTNYSGKVTLRAAARHTLIGYVQAGRSRQPNRLDPSGLTTLTRTSAIHQTVESTTDQSGLGWIGKVEWQAALSDRLTMEARAGQFGSNRTETPNGSAPRVEDIGSMIVLGGNRAFRERIRRDQVVASASYYRSGWRGTHHLKGGVDSYRTRQTDSWRRGYAGDVLHVVRNGVAQSVFLLQTPSDSSAGVWSHAVHGNDLWRFSDHVALNLGLRFDRYRIFLPAQEHPAGRFNPRPQRFAAADNVADWNVMAPRVAVIVDVNGDGRTIVKGTYSHYVENPGVATAFNANPNASIWWRSHAWSDDNGNGLWEPGEERGVIDNRGGTAVEQLDPELQLPYVRELSAAVDRELGAGINLRTSLVRRDEAQQFLRQNVRRPFDAFAVAVDIPDPGPDGVLGTADDGPTIAGRSLPLELTGLAAVNVVRNVADADARYWTFDVEATRRLRGRWSLAGGVAHTWSRDQANVYFGQSVRQNLYPLTPNDLINTSNGRHVFRVWNAKAYGTYRAPADVLVAALVRHQSGQPWGRTFTTPSTYAGTLRVLAEPVGTRRMDNVTLVDVRVERSFVVRTARVALFVDVFNLFNANPEQNISWSSGTFRQPLSIVPPRIARIGARVDW